MALHRDRLHEQPCSPSAAHREYAPSSLLAIRAPRRRYLGQVFLRRLLIRDTRRAARVAGPPLLPLLLAAGWLVAGCFSPTYPEARRCAEEDNWCPSGQKCVSGICRTVCSQSDPCPSGRRCASAGYCEALDASPPGDGGGKLDASTDGRPIVDARPGDGPASDGPEPDSAVRPDGGPPRDGPLADSSTTDGRPVVDAPKVDAPILIDAPPLCGNGRVEAAVETCDIGIPRGTTGYCPQSADECDDGLVCTADTLANTGTCRAECIYQGLPSGQVSDGCCPPGESYGTDIDCPEECGNGLVEGTELCDTGIDSGDGACPTTVADCADAFLCTKDTLEGQRCWAKCAHPLITECSRLVPDGCCPPGCTPDAADLDNFDKDCCPPGMVRISPTTCIDAYEASNRNGIAVSVPRETPWTSVGWAEADARCRAVEKRLCTLAEFQAACGGPLKGLDQTVCNGGDTDPSELVANTGSFGDCEGGYPGIFDLVGNVWEWTSTCTDVQNCTGFGGSFKVQFVDCSSIYDKFGRTTSVNYVGFRCCK
ncbi:MAG: SUMF1/EgtB/PvdO family nonheme iron enzyme [Pseudomonadota bacterium]